MQRNLIHAVYMTMKYCLEVVKMQNHQSSSQSLWLLTLLRRKSSEGDKVMEFFSATIYRAKINPLGTMGAKILLFFNRKLCRCHKVRQKIEMRKQSIKVPCARLAKTSRHTGHDPCTASVGDSLLQFVVQNQKNFRQNCTTFRHLLQSFAVRRKAISHKTQYLPISFSLRKKITLNYRKQNGYSKKTDLLCEEKDVSDNFLCYKFGKFTFPAPKLRPKKIIRTAKRFSNSFNQYKTSVALCNQLRTRQFTQNVKKSTWFWHSFCANYSPRKTLIRYPTSNALSWSHNIQPKYESD